VSILKSGRAIFNLGGNHFRVITKIFYVTQIVQIRFAGSHAEYDRVDAEII
jgi:mRNA interferase HigB